MLIVTIIVITVAATNAITDTVFTVVPILEKYFKIKKKKFLLANIQPKMEYKNKKKHVTLCFCFVYFAASTGF